MVLGEPGACGGCEGLGGHRRYCPQRPDLADVWAQLGPPRRLARVHVCGRPLGTPEGYPCPVCGGATSVRPWRPPRLLP